MQALIRKDRERWRATDKDLWDESAITERGIWLAGKAISVWQYATVD